MANLPDLPRQRAGWITKHHSCLLQGCVFGEVSTISRKKSDLIITFLTSSTPTQSKKFKKKKE